MVPIPKAIKIFDIYPCTQEIYLFHLGHRQFLGCYFLRCINQFISSHLRLSCQFFTPWCGASCGEIESIKQLTFSTCKANQRKRRERWCKARDKYVYILKKTCVLHEYRMKSSLYLIFPTFTQPPGLNEVSSREDKKKKFWVPFIILRLLSLLNIWHQQ